MGVRQFQTTGDSGQVRKQFATDFPAPLKAAVEEGKQASQGSQLFKTPKCQQDQQTEISCLNNGHSSLPFPRDRGHPLHMLKEDLCRGVKQ